MKTLKRFIRRTFMDVAILHWILIMSVTGGTIYTTAFASGYWNMW